MTDANASGTLVGKALYLEFRKGVNTAQIIVTPESLSTGGSLQPAGSWRRQISTWSPKKPWRFYVGADYALMSDRRATVSASHTLVLPNPELDVAREMGASLVGTLATTLNNLYNNDWKIYQKPIVVDYSAEDSENTVKMETPAALIRRILRARKELGFADELLNAE
jgi:hypothetical protein